MRAQARIPLSPSSSCTSSRVERKRITGLSDEALAALLAYGGGERAELEHAIERR